MRRIKINITFFSVSLLFFITVLLSSCATTISMEVTRPAALDLKGARTIAVLPFSSSLSFPFSDRYNGSTVIIGNFFTSHTGTAQSEKQIINYIKNEIEAGLIDSPYITLINSESVKNAINNGKPNPADVYITGEVVTFNVIDEEKLEKVPVKKEEEPEDNSIYAKAMPEFNEYISEQEENQDFTYKPYYTREVLLVVSYQIVDGISNKVISFETMKMSEKSGIVYKKNELPNPYNLIHSELENFVSAFLRKLQPYTVNKSITLLDDKTKNPDMKNANKLAKDGYLRESYNSFYNIYSYTGMFEAGYNAALLLMAMGNLNGAESLMEEVAQKSGRSEAFRELRGIRKEIELAGILREQINRDYDSDLYKK